jgi:glycine cleavage system regulatory protein
LASVPAENTEILIGDLRQLENEGLQITVHRSAGVAEVNAGRQVVLELLGQDRPGIIRDITAVLSRHGVNVLELDSSCESASMSGEMLFKAKARLLLPPRLSRSVLQSDLEQLANELMVDLNLAE